MLGEKSDLPGVGIGGFRLHWEQVKKHCTRLEKCGRHINWIMAKRLFEELKNDGDIFDSATEAINVFACRIWNFGGVK
jgi:hypothetical protein